MGEPVMTLWKSTERAIAKLLGGIRVPITGRQRGDVPDVLHPKYSIEVKHRQNLPDWLLEAMEQAEAAKRGSQVPMVVLHMKGRKHMDDLVVFKIRDIIEKEEKL
jgi:hypothetical protein